MQKLDAALTKLNKSHEFYSYNNAGHAFMDNTKESYRATPTKIPGRER